MILKLVAVTTLALVTALALGKNPVPVTGGNVVAQVPCTWGPDPLHRGKQLDCRLMVAYGGDSTGTDGGRWWRVAGASLVLGRWMMTGLQLKRDSAGRQILVSPVSGELRLVVDSDTLAPNALKIRGGDHSQR